MKKWILFALFLVLYALIVYIGFRLDWLKKPLVVSEADFQTEIAVEPHFAPNSPYSAYLDLLASKENCGEGIIDRNGLVSKGDFCFQKQTYLYFVKRYNLYPYAEEQELLSNWGDRWTEEQIVNRIIEEDKNLLAIHWVLSVKAIGLPQ